VTAEEILTELLEELAEIDGRSPFAMCQCGGHDCATCLKDEVRALVVTARKRLERVRLGVVAA
jgi:hypothetical protein